MQSAKYLDWGGVGKMIYWKEEYRIGINHIDEQHKRWFLIAEEVYNLFNQDTNIDKTNKIMAIMSELKDYTIYHFNFEESYMKEIDYKNYNRHKEAHARFIDKINSVNIYELGDDLNEHIQELLEYMIKWLYLHILNTDRELIQA
jgi:hemerythrin